jgi:phosphoribosylaminoimidazolecarboxamide formyltransferase/IMP cyclohydrolase
LKKFALISVSDKTNIIEFAKKLASFDYEILATGNTSKLLIENGINTTEIANFTGFPEIFSGRVKTLQPKIFGGILMRPDNEKDKTEALQNGIEAIDIVCVNLYPFPQVVNRTDVDLETKIENIDIGGPSLIRASAKNYKFVSVLTSPSQYAEFTDELSKGAVSAATREKLAAAAFAYTSYYDTLIADFLEEKFLGKKTALRINSGLADTLRYGENPHQKAFLYGGFFDYFEVLSGKELSYNNLVDLTAAIDLVNDLENTACAIVKHTNPCGAASASNVIEAYEKALSCDPVSAYGGIVAFNTIVDEATALKLNEIFLEIVVAPGYTEKAVEYLKIKKNRRLIKVLKSPEKDRMQLKNVAGGYLVQEGDNSVFDKDGIKTVTKRKCTESELKELRFAWAVCKHTKSNAIVYTKDRRAIAVGAGQMSRVDSAKIAAMKAKVFGHDLNGAVAASDAYFPFADGLEVIASHGITAVVQPGGSVRDEEVIEAANKYNIAMVFTGIRNFKH